MSDELEDLKDNVPDDASTLVEEGETGERLSPSNTSAGPDAEVDLTPPENPSENPAAAVQRGSGESGADDQ